MTFVQGLLVIMLLIFPVAAAQAEAPIPAAPGALIDVGGYALHLWCTGKGNPTVIMDAGLGDWSLHFRALQTRLSATTQVCTFDRAGMGWSEVAPKPRTSQRIVDELERLLAGANQSGPYILVGHSFGGLNMVLFAHDHLEDVAGVVLIDASHPQQTKKLSAAPSVLKLQDSEIEGLARLATAIDAGQAGPSDVRASAPAGIPEAWRDTWAQLFARPESLRTSVAEYAALDTSMAQVDANGSLGDIPLIVIAHGLKLAATLPPAVREQAGLAAIDLETYESVWRAMQKDHLSRSSRSRMIVAKNSPHYVYFTEPNLVVAAIRDLVQQYRMQKQP